MQKLRSKGDTDANRINRFAQEASGFYVGVSPNGACKSVEQASSNMRALYNYNANRLSAKNASMANSVANKVVASIPGLTTKDIGIAQSLAASALADYDQAVMSGNTADLPSDKNGYVVSRVYNDLYRMSQERSQYELAQSEAKLAQKQQYSSSGRSTEDELALYAQKKAIDKANSIEIAERKAEINNRNQ